MSLLERSAHFTNLCEQKHILEQELKKVRFNRLRRTMSSPSFCSHQHEDNQQNSYKEYQKEDYQEDEGLEQSVEIANELIEIHLRKNPKKTSSSHEGVYFQPNNNNKII